VGATSNGVGARVIRRATAGRGTRYSFAHEAAPGCCVEVRPPGCAVAYEEGVLERLYAAAGLDVERSVRYGSWSGAYRDARQGQDTIVADRH
jgi:hypothetical protein